MALAPARVDRYPPSRFSADPSLALLDPGERAAILLAQEHNASLLLIDERRGRLEAQRRGLSTTGTLGVLLSAHLRGLLNAEAMYQDLVTTTNFRSTPELANTFLLRVRGIGNKSL
jgi:predicted nucleic acid-binding protein